MQYAFQGLVSAKERLAHPETYYFMLNLQKFITFSVLVLSQISLLSQTSGVLEADAPNTTPPPVDHVRVSVLGYHDFSSTRKVQEMVIRPNKFREQMQAIKDLKLNVISMQEFTLWKQGRKSIPDKSILITIDDGWLAVYEEAFPVLKEFGYPFTVYLYTNYLDRGGRSMTTEMIKEMMKHGCTIGSHSVSHPLPSTVRKHQRQGAEAFRDFIHTEFNDSKLLLEKKFNQEVITYVYPGGLHTPEMLEVADEVGYKYLYTVKPGKVTRATNNKLIPRYVILGEDKHDYIFKHATSFSANIISRGTSGVVLKKKTRHPVSPAPGDKITERTPTISVDLSNVSNLDPTSLNMNVAGFGNVPASYNTESKTFSWEVNRPLRRKHCTTTVTWKTTGAKDREPPIEWTFVIDKQGAYTPKTAPALP